MTSFGRNRVFLCILVALVFFAVLLLVTSEVLLRSASRRILADFALVVGDMIVMGSGNGDGR
jgi:uncharacterized membrane protein